MSLHDADDRAGARRIYDEESSRWSRRAPVCLSDFTGRPPVLELCEPLAGARVLDLGCGEGYVARLVKQRGAASVLGLDLSSEMIRRATELEREQPLGIEYRTANAVAPTGLAEAAFDLVIAVFLFNYLTIEQTHGVLAEAFRVLRPGGHLVFAVPHPSLAFLHGNLRPFYFDRATHGYFSGRDQVLHGKIWRRDGAILDVRSVHKTLEDYLVGLSSAGFSSLPVLRELGVSEEHLALDPEFFGGVADTPLHLAIRTRKPI